MKLLDHETTGPPTATMVATEMLNAAHYALRLTRAELRRQPSVALSLTQIRALDYLMDHPDASLSAVADHVGFALPSASVLIDGLVRRALVVRLTAARDRRRVRLRLTPAGKTELRKVQDVARAALAERLGALSPTERRTVTRALTRISAVLAPLGHAARVPVR